MLRQHFRKINQLGIPVAIHHVMLPVEYDSFTKYTNLRRTYGRCVAQMTNQHKIYFIEGKLVTFLREVSFRIEEGDVYTLLGPSSYRKTTIPRYVAGLEKPHEREIILGDTKKRFV